ncbi:Uncharacterised protein [Chlamydia trachomatis]|nr:Uncharacterised protein [Chlamydia trachomatis]
MLRPIIYIKLFALGEFITRIKVLFSNVTLNFGTLRNSAPPKWTPTPILKIIVKGISYLVIMSKGSAIGLIFVTLMIFIAWNKSYIRILLSFGGRVAISIPKAAVCQIIAICPRSLWHRRRDSPAQQANKCSCCSSFCNALRMSAYGIHSKSSCNRYLIVVKRALIDQSRPLRRRC